MDITQIRKAKDEIEAELNKIDKIKEELKNSLNALSSLEVALGGNLLCAQPYQPKQINLHSSISANSTTPDIAAEIIETPSYRVSRALGQMIGKFSRSDLYEKTMSDGMGDIKRGTYSPIFSKLVNRKKIVCVEGSPGQKGSMYAKASEAGTPVESPTTERDEKLF